MKLIFRIFLLVILLWSFSPGTVTAATQAQIDYCNTLNQNIRQKKVHLAAQNKMISDDASALKRFENYFDAETRDARVCLDNKMPPKNSPTAKEFIKRCRQENPEILINSHPRVTRASCEDFQFPEVQKLYREFCDIRGRGVKGTADYIQGLKK
ncbi:MAG: hypothetical protein R3257_04945, partial [bacterium]|nr:hypothetical protein [bacterium]